MKKNRFFIVGILMVLLTFGLVLSGCSNSSGSTPVAKTVVITGIPGAVRATIESSSFQIGIFPPGINNTNAQAETGLVAGTASAYLSGSGGNNTLTTTEIWVAPGFTEKWTGSGTYDLVFNVTSGSGTWQVVRNLSITNATTSVAYTSLVTLTD
ncbi:hypothetical protein AGMMS50230_12790 [Spirochaetia bacterium]|nr:hypothetical protein AGMMS50230_12790 [Spirochaetia bacterium]